MMTKIPMEDIVEKVSDIYINQQHIAYISEQYDHPNRTFKYYVLHMADGSLLKITDKKLVESFIGIVMPSPKQGKKK